MPKQRVLLLNPPGDELYLRDYYCSKISKANYVYQPTDLLILSGILGQRHEVHVLDAIISRLSFEEALRVARSLEPDVVVFLTGAVSKRSDFRFVAKLRERAGARVIGTGDVLMEGSEAVLENEPWLDAIVLDFTREEILDYLDGAEGPFESMLYQRGGKVVSARWRRSHGIFQIPVPQHELFLDRRYTHPFVRRSPMATVLTDYGCPFRCRFCVMASLGYKVRPVDNVMEELEYVASLGVREIYFNDQTFGADKKRTRALCEAMMERGFGFGWACFSRVDVVDESFLRLMKAAGCHTITFGVESGNDEIRSRARKGFTREQIVKAFEMCHAHAIDAAATFILGLPDETREDLLASMEFAIELDCDFASFNVAVPRMRTELREEAVSSGLVSAETTKMDQSGTYAVMGTRHLDREETEHLVALAIRRFYCRPRYILRRLLHVRSWYDLRRHIVSGLAVMRDVTRRFL